MPLHPSVRQAIAGFRANELHAARAGRDVMHALAQTALASPAQDTLALAPEIEQVIDTLLAVMPAYAPPLNVMHRILTLIDKARDQNLTLETLRSTLVDASNQYAAWSQDARARIAEYGTNWCSPETRDITERKA